MRAPRDPPTRRRGSPRSMRLPCFRASTRRKAFVHGDSLELVFQAKHVQQRRHDRARNEEKADESQEHIADEVGHGKRKNRRQEKPGHGPCEGKGKEHGEVMESAHRRPGDVENISVACSFHTRAHAGRFRRHNGHRLTRSPRPVAVRFVEMIRVARDPLARGAVHEGLSQEPRQLLGHLPRLDKAHGLYDGDGLRDPLAGELHGPGCGGVAVAALRSPSPPAGSASRRYSLASWA